jgi:hypothetical protein
LAYKAEHAVDLETGAVVAVTVATGDAGDTATILETLPEAGIRLVLCGRNDTPVPPQRIQRNPRSASWFRADERRKEKWTIGPTSADGPFASKVIHEVTWRDMPPSHL